jgi:NitT/TauT family transport system substrate-binding protein
MLTVMDYIGIPADRVVESHDFDALPGLLQSGEMDAVLSFYPFSEGLRGVEGVRVALNSAEDPPYSEHFCCVIYGRSEFVRKYPAATKRTLRAILKAIDFCANDVESAARTMTEAPGSLTDYETTLRLLGHLDWTFWRTIDPEASLRFYGLRLHESGALSTAPDELIARATDWSFLNQIKGEMAAFPAPPPRRASLFGCDVPGQARGFALRSRPPQSPGGRGSWL